MPQPGMQFAEVRTMPELFRLFIAITMTIGAFAAWMSWFKG
jgi:hypothetical protein